MEIRVPHTLPADEAAARVRKAAERFDLFVPDGGAAVTGTAGVLVKETHLGSVRARWEVLADELVVTVEERPAFLPEGTVRRALEDGLRQMLAG